MNTILSNSMNELQKLLAKKVVKIFLSMAILLPILFKLLVSRLFITDWMNLPTEHVHFTLLDLFITILLPLFIFISATDLFTSEEEKGTLFQVRPISRMELFLSKTIGIGFFTLIQLLLVWISITISSLLLDKAFDFTHITSSLGAFIISWIPLLVMIAFAVMIALMVRSSTVAIAGMITLYLIMLVIPYFMPNLLYILPSTYLDWYMQWQRNTSITSILQTITYLCSAFTLFFTIGYYMFSNKEA